MTFANLNERDIQFFEEVYGIMKNKYPEMAERFGIWRIHQHFQLNENELFHETTNQETKESTLKIINGRNLPKNAFPSTWKLTEGGPMPSTWCCED